MSTVQAIGVIILRILALLIILSQLVWVSVAVAQYLQPTEDATAHAEELFNLVYQFVILLIGILILVLSRAIARRIAPDEHARGRSSLSPEDMIGGGSFLLGIFLLVQHLPGVLFQVVQAAVAAMRNLDSQDTFTLRFWHDGWGLAEQALILFIAFWLLLRPASLTGLYRWLRTAGLPKPEPVEEAAKAE